MRPLPPLGMNHLAAIKRNPVAGLGPAGHGGLGTEKA